MASRRPADPAFFHVPDGSVFTIADETADLMDAVGYTVEDPERLVLRALLPQKPNGDWVGLQSAVVCARQNIKTATMIGCALHDTFVQGVERVVWTAHEFKTSSDAFTDFQSIIEANDWLSREVLKVRTANGKEGFELRNGSRLDILARTGKSGRGLASPRLYGDEGLYLEGKMMGALVPTMSAMRNPHFVIGSSPGVPMSAVLRGIRDRGRSGIDTKLGYIEWTSKRFPCANPECSHRLSEVGCQLDNEELYWDANPALGRRITLEFVREERRILGNNPTEFMRERLGWWEDPPFEGEVEPVVPAESWLERLDVDSSLEPGCRIAIALDMSWDRKTTWACVVGVRADGVPHAEIVARDFGTDWISSFIREFSSRWKPCAIGLQGGNAPISSILDALIDEFGDLIRPITGPDVSRASGVFYDSVVNGPFVHIGQQQLDDAMEKAVARPIGGDAWAWDRKASQIDIAPLVAVTNALYLVKTAPAPVVEETYIPKRLR